MNARRLDTDIEQISVRDTVSTVYLSNRNTVFQGLDSTTLIVTDQNTDSLIRTEETMPALRAVVPAGEQCKDIRHLETLLDVLLKHEFTRDSTLIAVGGGAVTDLGAATASLYLRGIPLVLVPTTLLGMVDAAIGGKTGVNFGAFKNLVGTFYPAQEIRICLDFLQTLPEAEYRSGLAEVIKAAMLGDARLFEILESEPDAVRSRDPAVTEELVRRAVSVKAVHVREDLTEQGIRAHLNLGHTFAHALESVAGFGAVAHGDAVAWGIVQALRLGSALGITDRGYRERSEALLRTYGYRFSYREFSTDSLIAAMKHDKKRNSGGMRFVLQRGAQETQLMSVDEGKYRSLLDSER